LRGAAILLVWLFHYGWDFFDFRPGSLGAYLLTPLRLAWSGVDLFFVLSGFLIARFLVAHRDTKDLRRHFLYRRAFRILPVYLPMFALFLGGVVLHRQGIIDMPKLFGSADGLWTYALFLQNFWYALHGVQLNFFSVSWSLSIECQFYLVFPFVVLAIRDNRKLMLILSVLAILAPLQRMGLEFIAPEVARSANNVLPTARTEGLALGALIAVWERMAYRDSGRRSGTHVACCLLLVSTVLMALAVIRSGMYGPLLYTVTAVYYAALLFAVRCDVRPLVRFFSQGWLRGLGKISYSAYLVHMPVLGLLAAISGFPDVDLVGPKPRWITGAATMITLILSVALFKWIEGPANEFARRQFRFGD
jgi:peptidoglycan/LPS O-acetylase OafA/YrhL